MHRLHASNSFYGSQFTYISLRGNYFSHACILHKVPPYTVMMPLGLFSGLSPTTARLARTLLLGQVISLLVAGTGVCSGLLAQRGISIPTSQSSLNYYLLALAYGGYRIWQAKKRSGGSGLGFMAAAISASVPWWRYAILALCDVEANYFVVKAYAYTSVTSIMLIDCWSIAVAMGLSWYFLKRKFGAKHVAGVGLCILGLAVLAVSDAGGGGSGGGSGSGGLNSTSAIGNAFGSNLLIIDDDLSALARPAPSSSLSLVNMLPQRAAARFLSFRGLETKPLGDADSSSGASRAIEGDLLCLLAATLYGISNVGQEALVKSHDRTEFLALVGIWGSAFNTAQLIALERGELSSALGDGSSEPGIVAGLVLGFAACLFAMYSLTSVFLQHCDATLFNLSLLTSDGWAILMALLLFGESIPTLYWPALALIIAGLALYNRAPPPDESASVLHGGDGDAAGQSDASSRQLDEETGEGGAASPSSLRIATRDRGGDGGEDSLRSSIVQSDSLASSPVDGEVLIRPPHR